MRRGKWIQCQWEQLLEGKQWYFKGGIERAVNLFPDSGLTVVPVSLDCCYQSVEQGGRSQWSSLSEGLIQSYWMGSTWAALWMDLCHSVEIFISSLLGCSGKIFFPFFYCGQRINHIIVKRFTFLEEAGRWYVCCKKSIWNYMWIVKSVHSIVLCYRIAEILKTCFSLTPTCCDSLLQFHLRCVFINFCYLPYLNCLIPTSDAQLTCAWAEKSSPLLCITSRIWINLCSVHLPFSWGLIKVCLHSKIQFHVLIIASRNWIKTYVRRIMNKPRYERMHYRGMMNACWEFAAVNKSVMKQSQGWNI